MEKQEQFPWKENGGKVKWQKYEINKLRKQSRLNIEYDHEDKLEHIRKPLRIRCCQKTKKECKKEKI